MPPKRLQDEPSIDGPSRSSSYSEEGDEESSHDETRETRATHNAKLRKLVDENGPLPLIFQKCDGRPIGQYAAMFATELGLAVKAHAPLSFDSWSKVPVERKMPIFDRLKRCFDVDFSKDPKSANSVWDETNKMMGRRYSNNRTKMHNYYKKLLDLPWEQRLEKMPEKYCTDEKDWKFLCTLFESDKFKGRSLKNTANRAKMPFNHCGGSKSFVQHSYELGGEPARVDRIVLYKKTHFNSSTSEWTERAETIYNEMVELREQYRQKRVDEGLPPMNEFELAFLVCDEVLGKRSRYIKGLGQGPKPSKPTSSDAGYRRTTNIELREELTTTQEELERTRAALQISQDKIQSLESTVEGNQRMMMQFFQKIAPDVLQSLMGQSSTSSKKKRACNPSSFSVKDFDNRFFQNPRICSTKTDIWLSIFLIRLQLPNNGLSYSILH